MTADYVPGNLRVFILKHIDSITQLEALLLLRANPDVDWDVTTAQARLYAPESEVRRVLERLSADGLLCREGTCYRYKPSITGFAETVDQLAALYSSHLIPITNLIHDKLRNVRAFSEAFKFRKER